MLNGKSENVQYFSAFTGVMGLDMGLPDDWECVGVSEIDKNACKVIRYKKPGVKNYGDIEKINYEQLPDFDILVGGSPCQDVSVAGKRAGLSGVRSGLFFSYVALLKVKKPRYFIFENVKGLLSTNEGRAFAEVVNQSSEAGYDIWWQVLDATWFGIPQHRERVFILGTLGKTGFRKVFFKRKNGRKNTELQGQSTIGELENMHISKSQPNKIYGTNGVAPTLHRKTGGDQVTKITVINPEQTQARKIYNPTNSNMATLNSIAHGGIAKPKIVVSDKEINSLTPQQTHKQLSIYKTDGISPTLDISHEKKKIAIPVADLTHETGRQNGRRVKTASEPSFTLQKMQRQGTYDGMKIRYLTPLECERLMGWPDEHTRYGIDEKGNTVEISDNARYNLIGNGVVPQVVRGILSNLITNP